jgi:hypothetical protein
MGFMLTGMLLAGVVAMLTRFDAMGLVIWGVVVGGGGFAGVYSMALGIVWAVLLFGVGAGLAFAGVGRRR